MNRRIRRDLTFLHIAEVLSDLSTCDRKQVGAVITRDGRCVSWGYNGTAPGLPHCHHTTDEPCEDAVHAELNAVAFAARQGISTDNGTLYVTVSPCVKCSHALIAAGIRRVVYNEAYRDPRGVEVLKEAGVEVQITP